jgi:DNA mismatch endonuclease, patch repair protein
MPTPERSAIMRAVKSRGNASTEQKMVQILRRAKLSGWRRHYQVVGTPDFAFPGERVALMVHGCFWHGCPMHHRRPKENAAYWTQKIERNMRRDRLVKGRLRRAGWSVLTFWEHDLKRESVVASRIQRALEQRRGS